MVLRVLVLTVLVLKVPVLSAADLGTFSTPAPAPLAPPGTFSTFSTLTHLCTAVPGK
jgi:hypothetical protein